ncbi:GGDEF domain-containing protein [Treponema sp. J25]|uniref:GGDEF domain-containing protein n=1 Tax=Treponema sp. J25 TaxID=2094121 RepID=UPI001045BF4C|nr:GGDEF domain-containing protein [Treponema sp. J25]TCW61002.1 GGDEF domain-containing protein [Treponema sp. J25]
MGLDIPLPYRRLLGCPLFSTLTDLELNAVLAFLERRHFKKGEVIFTEGEEGKEMFIVLEGKIAATIQQGGKHPRTIHEFGPGEFFGEMAVIEQERRSATCTALEDSDLLVLQGIDFFRLVFEHPMISLKLLTSIGKVMSCWLDESSRYLNDLVRWGEAARHRAITDPLTGLYNRRFFEENLRNRLSHGLGGGRSLAVVMVDLDRIHEVNEHFGSRMGDLVIQEVARSFTRVLRDTDVAARLAGDEFAILLPDTDARGARVLGERLRKMVESLKILLPALEGAQDPIHPEKASPPAETPHNFIQIHTSVGIALAPRDGTTLEMLLERADGALRDAKETGRNKVVLAGDL